MEIKQKLCPPGLSTNPGRNLKSIDYITIHCTGNYAEHATAKMHADYQYDGADGRQASWHYTVDDIEIWQSYNNDQECWHTGDGNNGPGNYTSIGIEICVNKQSAFSRACRNAAQLTASLLRTYGLPNDRVVQHYKWNGKNCPAELRSGVWGVSWEQFLDDVAFYRETPEVSDVPSDWAKIAWNWGVENRITDGTKPHAYATREQVLQLLYNYWQYSGHPVG